jgi:hypothetical protein
MPLPPSAVPESVSLSAFQLARVPKIHFHSIYRRFGLVIGEPLCGPERESVEMKHLGDVRAPLLSIGAAPLTRRNNPPGVNRAGSFFFRLPRAGSIAGGVSAL